MNDYCDEYSDFALTEILDGIVNTEDEKFEYRLHLRHPCIDAWLGVLFTRLCNLKSITFMFINPCGVILKIADRAALRQRLLH